MFVVIIKDPAENTFVLCLQVHTCEYFSQKWKVPGTLHKYSIDNFPCESVFFLISNYIIISIFTDT